LDDKLFSDLQFDETKRKQIKLEYLSKRHRSNYAMSRRALETEIQRAERISEYKIPIEDYNPNQMLNALRSFREAAFRQDILHLQDINLHIQGIALDGPLLERLVLFWRELPEVFDSHIESTNLNTQNETLKQNFDKARQRITILSPASITINSLYKGMEHLIGLRQSIKKKISTESAKRTEKDEFQIKETFEDRLTKFEVKLKDQMDEFDFIDWDAIIPSSISLSNRIQNAHYLSHLTFATQLRLIKGGFQYLKESR